MADVKAITYNLHILKMYYHLYKKQIERLISELFSVCKYISEYLYYHHQKREHRGFCAHLSLVNAQVTLWQCLVANMRDHAIRPCW